MAESIKTPHTSSLFNVAVNQEWIDEQTGKTIYVKSGVWALEGLHAYKTPRGTERDRKIETKNIVERNKVIITRRFEK